MNVPHLFEQHEALCQIDVGSKKSLFQHLSQVVNQHYPTIGIDTVFNGLIHRDRLGSTSIGHGVAVPHCRLPGCPHLITQLATLSSPLDFDAIDDRPVDIVFMLLAPEQHQQAHLDALAQVSAFFSDPVIRMKLRKAQNANELTQLAETLSEKILREPMPSIG